MNKNKNILKGKKGEELASNYLKKSGYKILKTNWHYSKNGEIDIIAEKDGTLVFVEVKTRTNLLYGHPFEAINTSKLNKIHKSIIGYISECDKKYNDYRLDGIAIIGLDNPTIEHIQNIGQY